MDQLKLLRASVQFDYFSDNFEAFRKEFYAYSNMAIPLPFLADDILQFMSEKQINYFKLPKELSKDKRDHYFVFTVKMQKDNNQVRNYLFSHHTRSEDLNNPYKE